MNKILKISAGVILIILVALVFFRVEISYYLWRSFEVNYISQVFNPKDPELYFEKGLYYFDNKSENYDYTVARKMFEKTVKLDNEHYAATYNLARTYFLGGELERAKELLSRALEIDGTNKRPYYILGLVNTYGGDFEDAALNFEEFIAWSPEEWAGYNDLAWVYLQDGKYEEARDIAILGLETVDAENIWLKNNLGAAYLPLGNFQEALGEFLSATEIFYTLTDDIWSDAYPGNDPRQISIIKREFEGLLYFNLSKAYKELGDLKKSEEMLNMAREIIPPYSNLRESLYEN